MKAVFLAVLTLAFLGAAAQAQPQRFNSDFSTMQESGPSVAGGNGMTAGPNWRNQATLPMPGSQEISELPRYPLTDEAIPSRPVAPPVQKAAPRAFR